MIFENLTLGTRIDQCAEEEISKRCQEIKINLAKTLYQKINASQIDELSSHLFPLPKKRTTNFKGITSFSSKPDKARLSEMMQKVREDEYAKGMDSIDDSKKTKKILESLMQFEELTLTKKYLDGGKLSALRRLNREILASTLREPHCGELVKFTHLESLVISIAMTTSSIVGLSMI